MGKKAKKKNQNSITFRLVGRSQQDPLINYEDAPQAVLVEQKSSKDRKAEQRKYGIYYDDNYDYLQHLKECEEVEEDYYFEEFDPKGTRIKEIKPKDEIDKEEGIIKLPSSVFPSQYQESVGMLNKGVLPRGIRPDWDPDIVDTFLDDYEEDEDNLLQDDFMIQATGGEIKPNDNIEQEYDKDDELDYRKGKFVKFDDDSISEEADERYTIRTVGSKTEFTNYSLTSSVIKRNAKLNDLDEHFENFFLRDIAEEQENAEADDSDYENEEGNKLLENLIKENEVEKNEPKFHADLPKEHIIKIAERQLIEEEENKEDFEEVEIRLATGKNEFEDRWDCESILSNYSNIYHRPKLILEQRSNKIQINQKTGVPEESGKLTTKGLKNLNRQEDEQTIKSMTSLISQLSIRNKNETAEQRKLRKKELKEYMRDRRMEKKANRLAFKEEHLRLNNEKVVNRQLTALKYS